LRRERFLMVSPWQVRFPKWDIRWKRFREDYRLVMDSIKKYGFTTPIAVYRPRDWDESHEYEVLDGFHRLFAARQLNLSAIPVYILPIKERDAMRMAFTLNYVQRTLDPVSVALYLKHLREEVDMTLERIESITGISRRMIGRYLELLKLSDEELETLARSGWRGWTGYVDEGGMGVTPIETPKTPPYGRRCFVCGLKMLKGEVHWMPLCREHYREARRLRKRKSG